MNKAKSYFADIVSSNRYKGFNDLPCSVGFEILAYGHIITPIEGSGITMDVIESEDWFKDVNGYMNGIFMNLMEELYLTLDNGTPMFRRQQLTPDFFRRDGLLYKQFFNVINEDGSMTKTIMHLKRNDKIFKPLVTRADVGSIKSNIATVLEDGFYTVLNFNLSENIKPSALTPLAGQICSGLYKTIVVCMGDEDFSDLPPMVASAVYLVESNGTAKITRFEPR